MPYTLTRSTLLRLALASPLALLARPARAIPDTAAATRFIQQAGQELAADLNAPGSVATRRPQIVAFINQVVDVTAIGRFCLGRYLRSATPQQLQEYLQLFQVTLTNAILARLGNYEGGVRIQVGRAEPYGDGIHVPTQVLRASGPAYNVVWVVDNPNGPPQIVDLMAEGVSLRQTQRSDYESFLGRNSGNVGALIQALQNQAARGA